MTLLIDNQLPVALARHLQSRGWDAIHVADVGLASSLDSTIWRFAANNDLVIVSKDQDFQALAIRQGRAPPQVLWVRLGNCRRKALFDAFDRAAGRLRSELASGKLIVELV